nr:protein MRVI1-like [Paramormyrops kingsleyae]
MLGESGEDSEEELSQEDPLACWENLPILDRLGLSSTEMTEKEMESTFLQLASAFRCDQYTLQKRLQAEEHARNVAEWNVHLELEQGRDALQALKALCLDTKRSKILQRLELCLDVLAGSVQRITNTAEVLGAVHQEARVSHAVQLMMAHVEKLQWRHVRDYAELEEAKRMVQRSNCSRQLSDPRDEGEMRQKVIRSGQLSTRRRVSVAVIPTSQTRSEIQTLPMNPKANCQLDSRQLLNGVSDSGPFHSTGGPHTPPQVPGPSQGWVAKSYVLDLRSPSRDPTDRQCRNRGLKEGGLTGGWSTPTKHELQLMHSKDFSLYSFVDNNKQHPPQPWLSYCHWILFWMYVIALPCIVLLGVLLCCLQGSIFSL